MANLKLTADITNAFGPSGYEEDVVEVIKNYTKDFNVTVDPMKNVYAIDGERDPNKPTIMLDAHTDEVGFMVQAITANGLIRFVNIGGWVTTNIPAHTVIIKNSKGEYIKGITTSKPPHFMTDGEKNKKLELEDILIDVGATTRQEVIEVFGIQPGDPISPDVTLEHIEKNNVLLGKAFDNRIGCQCIIETLTNLKGKELKANVVGAFASQEEVGCRGAKVTVNTVKPQLAIVFEGSPADDLFRDEHTAQCVLKKGVQIRYVDGGMVSHPGFIRFARKIADELGIPYQTAVRRAGSTNGAVIHTGENGIPCLVLGIPSRYAHTHYCYLAPEDVDATIKLACEIINRLDEDTLKEITHG